MKKIFYVLIWLGISTIVFLQNVHAQDSAVERLKKQMVAPVILYAEQFQLKSKTYVVAILKEPFLFEPKVRIYSVEGINFDEEYEEVGVGEEFNKLLIMDVTGDKIPEIVSLWNCGQRGLKCLNVIARDRQENLRFENAFTAQASEIEFGPRQEGKPVEIYLTDIYDKYSPKPQIEKRTFIFDGKDFVEKKEQLPQNKK